ncbi:MAG: acyltransferase family protein [Stenotrophobium sp.]
MTPSAQTSSHAAVPADHGRITELDGLRGIAAAGVVAFHLFPGKCFWMWSFVDLFFVLSGFLISRILLESLRAQRFSLKYFWARRILRIWPVYYLAVLVVGACNWLWFGSDFLHGPYLRDVLLSLVYLQFTPLYFHGIGDATAMFYFPIGLLHIWSLAVEEQFYILWPLALMLLGYRRMPAMVALCIGAFAVGPVFRILGFAPALLLTRIDGLALGVLLAIVVTVRLHHRPAAGYRTWLLDQGFCWLALVPGLILVGPYFVRGYLHGVDGAEIFRQPWLVSGFALSYFALVGLVVYWCGRRLTAGLRLPLLTYLGSISYAMYMFHFPILYWITPRLEELCGNGHHWLVRGLTLVLIVGFAHLSKVLIENPILALKARFSQGRHAPLEEERAVTSS